MSNSGVQYQDAFEDFPEGERLYYNVMRYYDPGLGRYLTQERVIYVIELAKRVYDRYDRGVIDLNGYRYSYSNPIFYHDMYGLQGIPGTEIPQPYQRCLVEIFGGGCIWRTQLIPRSSVITYTLPYRIYLEWDIKEFFSKSEYMQHMQLHEFFHVCKQWRYFGYVGILYYMPLPGFEWVATTCNG